MTGTMAGNIMATIPTIQITMKDSIAPMFGALNMLAIVAMGTAGAVEFMAIDAEV